MGELDIQIFDNEWPKLRLVGTFKLPNGEIAHFDAKAPYDHAYIQFENALHNALRKVVEAVIQRRKNPAGFRTPPPQQG